MLIELHPYIWLAMIKVRLAMSQYIKAYSHLLFVFTIYFVISGFQSALHLLLLYKLVYDKYSYVYLISKSSELCFQLM